MFMNPEHLRTPYFLVDLPAAERNARTMAENARKAGVRLRPHVKTHKTIEGARLQVQGHFGGITVSTLAEADYFAKGGFEDMIYAFPVSPDKLPQVHRLMNQVQAFHILIDHSRQLTSVEEYAASAGITFSVFLKVDSGSRRSGVPAGRKESVQLARKLDQSPAVDFQGILTHAGHTYQCDGIQDIKEVADEQNQLMSDFARELSQAGVTVNTIATGDTPGCSHLSDHRDVNEIRPGNYLFFDKLQADIGSCMPEDCAGLVASRVVSHYPDRNRMVIDAGALALSKDTGATHITGEVLFGAIRNHPELRLVKLSQEHGIIEGDGPIDYEAFPIGSIVHIIPNHSCLTAALFPEFQVMRDGWIVDTWRPVRGW